MYRIFKYISIIFKMIINSIYHGVFKNDYNYFSDSGEFSDSRNFPSKSVNNIY